MPVALQKLRVLVVDDDEDTAVSMAMLLVMWGHDASTARDGRTALAMAAAQCPEVVLLDVGLPDGLDGWQVAKKLTQNSCPKPFVIAITGHAGDDARVRSEEAGVNLHLTKPVPHDVLQGLLGRFRQVFAAG